MNDTDFVSPIVRERIAYYVQRIYALLGSRSSRWWMVKVSWWLVDDILGTFDYTS